MDMSSLTAFVAVSLLLALTPGADWAYVISAGLRDRSVLPAVSGLMLGYGGLTLVVAAGMAALVAATPSLLTGLTVLGAAYLTWLGVTTLTRQPTAPGDGATTPRRSPRRAVVQGAGTSGLNPKGLLLYLALLPQFVDRHAGWPVAAQMALLGLLHVIGCGLVYATVATLARTVLRARPAAARAVTRVSGAAMIVIGGLLLVERLAP